MQRDGGMQRDGPPSDELLTTPVLASPPSTPPAGSGLRVRPVAYFGQATDRGRRAYQEDLALAIPAWPAESTVAALGLSAARVPAQVHSEAGGLSGTLALLFDGHGGSRAALYAAHHLPKLLASALQTAEAGAASRAREDSSAPMDVAPGEQGRARAGGLQPSGNGLQPSGNGHGGSLGEPAEYGTGVSSSSSGGALNCSFGRAMHSALRIVDGGFCEWARRDKLHDGSTVLLALVCGCDVRFDPSALATGEPDDRLPASQRGGGVYGGGGGGGVANGGGGVASVGCGNGGGGDGEAGPSLHVANLGDSRCVLGCLPQTSLPLGAGRQRSSRSPSRAASAPHLEAVRLSFDHRPDDAVERERIVRAGGRVCLGRVSVEGCRMSLSVSRCLGDVALKDVRPCAQPPARLRLSTPRPSASEAPTAAELLLPAAEPTRLMTNANNGESGAALPSGAQPASGAAETPFALLAVAEGVKVVAAAAAKTPAVVAAVAAPAGAAAAAAAAAVVVVAVAASAAAAAVAAVAATTTATSAVAAAAKAAATEAAVTAVTAARAAAAAGGAAAAGAAATVAAAAAASDAPKPPPRKRARTEEGATAARVPGVGELQGAGCAQTETDSIEPHVVISLEPHVVSVRLGEAHRFVVLGSDGLYESLTDDVRIYILFYSILCIHI